MGVTERNKKGEIVFLEDSPSWGGVQKWIFSLAEGIRAYGWHVTIATPPEGELAQWASKASLNIFPIELSGNLGIFNPFTLRNFISYLKKNLPGTVWPAHYA